MMTVDFDDYVTRTLMRDLVGHDHKPAAYLCYVWLAAEQQRRGTAVPISYTELAQETGLSRSATQAAIIWLRRRELLISEHASITATPVYRTLRPWRREHR